MHIIRLDPWWGFYRERKCLSIGFWKPSIPPTHNLGHRSDWTVELCKFETIQEMSETSAGILAMIYSKRSNKLGPCLYDLEK
jgi:hypothetical protein